MTTEALTRYKKLLGCFNPRLGKIRPNQTIGLIKLENAHI